MWCGKSISHLYEFLNNEKLHETKKAQIFQLANQGDEKCKKTINWFLKFYAQEISNIALRHKTQGGIFLFGSISKSLIPYF